MVVVVEKQHEGGQTQFTAMVMYAIQGMGNPLSWPGCDQGDSNSQPGSTLGEAGPKSVWREVGIHCPTG